MKINITDNRKPINDLRLKIKTVNPPQVHGIVITDKLTSALQVRKSSESILPSNIIGSAAPTSGKRYVESTYNVPVSLNANAKQLTDNPPIFQTEPSPEPIRQ